MTADAICQRLAIIANRVEELAAEGWRLERERDELRHRLRALNAPKQPARGASA
jgi:hypothetical protein